MCVVVLSFYSTSYKPELHLKLQSHVTRVSALTDGESRLVRDSDCVTCFCRMVCQALVGSDSLEWERTQLWALTFKLIRKIIGGVDYKVKNKLKACVCQSVKTGNVLHRMPSFSSKSVF